MRASARDADAFSQPAAKIFCARHCGIPGLNAATKAYM
jgi:hypothetical protein